jgi:hypothetical protein
VQNYMCSNRPKSTTKEVQLMPLIHVLEGIGIVVLVVVVVSEMVEIDRQRRFAERDRPKTK